MTIDHFSQKLCQFSLVNGHLSFNTEEEGFVGPIRSDST